MSAWELTESPSKEGPPLASRPRLRSVAGRKGAPIRGLPFAVVVVVILAAGMIGLLGLNIYIQDEQMDLNKAQRQAAALALEVSDKQAQVYAKSGPGQLAAAAGALGMVPNPNPVFLDLRTGKVVGSPKPVTGDEMPALRQVAAAPATEAAPSPAATADPTPSASPAASPTPSAAPKA